MAHISIKDVRHFHVKEVIPMTNTSPQSAFFVPVRKLWAKHAELALFDAVSIHSY